MRPSTKVYAGNGATFMTTLASGSIVTVPQSGPCAQARTWSLVTPGGRWTVTLRGASTAVAVADELPVQLRRVLKRLAAPLAT